MLQLLAETPTSFTPKTYSGLYSVKIYADKMADFLINELNRKETLKLHMHLCLSLPDSILIRSSPIHLYVSAAILSKHCVYLLLYFSF